MSHTKSLDSIRDILFMVMDNKSLISNDKFKRARNDFLKSPSDLNAQYRYATAMVFSKDKTHVEEGLKLLKDLSCNANFPDLCNCLYNICYGAFRVEKYHDVKLYAEKLYKESPNLLPDKDMAVILHKTQSLVLLADEFLQKPNLGELVTNKSRKKGIKYLLHNKSAGKRDTKLHLRCMSDASRPPPQVVLTDVSNKEPPNPLVTSAKGFYRTPTSHMQSIPSFAVSTGHIGKKHLSVIAGPKEISVPTPRNDEQTNKRRSCPPNFLAASLSWDSTITSTPSSSLLQQTNPPPEHLQQPQPQQQEEPTEQPVLHELMENTIITQDNTQHSSAGEIMELEEQFSELRDMYDSLIKLNEKKNITQDHPSNYNYEKILVDQKDSSLSSGQLLSDETPIETPSRFLNLNRSSPPLKDFLSDSDSNNENQENALVIERALIDLPPLQLPETENRPFMSSSFKNRDYDRDISKSHYSLPTTGRKNHAHVTKSVSITSDSSRPWVIIRRYGRRGGKKIRLPSSLHDLIQISGDKLGIVPACIREVSTEAEIEDITSIDPDSVLWVMTAEDEKNFCNPEEF